MFSQYYYRLLIQVCELSCKLINAVCLVTGKKMKNGYNFDFWPGIFVWCLLYMVKQRDKDLVYVGSVRGVLVIVGQVGSAPRVQIMNEVACISHSSNTFGKGMNSVILSSSMGILWDRLGSLTSVWQPV